MTRLVVTLTSGLVRSDIVAWLLDRGVTCYRLNLARGQFSRRLNAARQLRQWVSERGLELTLFVDLPGRKARIGTVPSGKVALKSGQKLFLTVDNQSSDEDSLPLRGRWLLNEVTPGEVVKMGSTGMKVQYTNEKSILGTVSHNGFANSYDAIWIEGREPFFPELLEDDIRLIPCALEMGATHILPSFVESSKAPMMLREVLDETGGNPRIFSKIESRSGVDVAREILDASDGIVVGREDMSRLMAPNEVIASVDLLIELASLRNREIVPASKYFSAVAKTGRTNQSEARVIQRLIAQNVDYVVSNETAFSMYWREVVTAALAAGLR